MKKISNFFNKCRYIWFLKYIHNYLEKKIKNKKKKKKKKKKKLLKNKRLYIYIYIYRMK